MLAVETCRHRRISNSRERSPGLDVNPLAVVNSTVVGTIPLPPTITDDFAPVIFSIRSQLEDLLNINTPERGEISLVHVPADIVVSGGPLPATPIQVQFVGQFTGKDVALLHLDSGAPTTFDDDATSSQQFDSGADEVQTINLGGVTTGDLVLTFDTASTGNLDVSAVDGAAIEAALRGLTTINGPHVSVAGAVGGPFVVTFTGNLGSQNVLELVATQGTVPLTPGGISAIDITETTPGGSVVTTSVIQSSAIQARTTARLQVDPGIVVKLEGARIEAEPGRAQFIAEGTSERPIIFTSRRDDGYGGGRNVRSHKRRHGVSCGSWSVGRFDFQRRRERQS